MIRLPLFALAVAAVGTASASMAQASSLNGDSRNVTNVSQPATEAAGSGVIVRRDGVTVVEPRTPKPRIWISMGFGF